MDEQRQDNQLELTYNSFVPIKDVDLKTYRKRWTIEKGDGGGSGKSARVVWHDDDDDDWFWKYADVSFVVISLNDEENVLKSKT